MLVSPLAMDCVPTVVVGFPTRHGRFSQPAMVGVPTAMVWVPTAMVGVPTNHP